MSYANGTTHFNLPITSGSDKRDWADTNQAFQDIDAAIYQAGEDASTAGSGVTTLDTQINGVGGIDSRLTQAESDIDNVEGAVSTLQGTVSGHTTAIADVRRDLQDNIEAVNEPTATSTHAHAIGDYFYYNDILYKATAAIAIGDTIVPNTNCTATDVMSEVSANKSAANISLAPITGMAADDVQEGIAELKSDLGDKSTLKTNNKNSLVEAVNELYDYKTDKRTATTFASGSFTAGTFQINLSGDITKYPNMELAFVEAGNILSTTTIIRDLYRSNTTYTINYNDGSNVYRFTIQRYNNDDSKAQITCNSAVLNHPNIAFALYGLGE